ncbi:MAG: DUF58 domain-containing protein [Planctomycetota bacterium]
MSASSKYSSPEVLARIRSLELRAKHAVQGTLSGANRSPLLGQSVEFVDYREYAPGDDPKRLDWRVYSRSNRWFVKLYEEESNFRSTFILDASASMKYQGEKSAWSKYEYAATLIASMATLAIEQRDAAGLWICDETRREALPPKASRLQLMKLIDGLERSAPDRKTELGFVLNQAAAELPRRGLIFIVSDFLTDLDSLYKSLGHLQSRAHDIVLMHVLDRDEISLPFKDQIEFLDIEGEDRIMAEPRYFASAYGEAMEKFCREVEGRAGDFGADYLLIPSDDDLGRSLAYYLHRRKRISAKASRRGGNTPVTGGGVARVFGRGRAQ